jgi:hypothetical protein
MAIKTKKLSLTKAQLEFNLKEWFGVDFSGRFDLKQQITGSIVDTILKRTEAGKDVNGSAFAKYSSDYKKSLAFKAFGKSNKVNLELTGQMLGTMDLIDQTENKIIIGWEDDTEIKKAYNHNTGDTVPKREFFDLTEEELAKIKAQYKDELESELTPNGEVRRILGAIQSAESRLPNVLTFGEEDE